MAGLIATIAVLGLIAIFTVSAQIGTEMTGVADQRFARHSSDVTGAITELMDRVGHDLRLARRNAVIEDLQTSAGGPLESEARGHADSALQYIGGRYDVDETCIIGADGRELARWDLGASAHEGDLSADESINNPAFLPTLKLADDAVYRSEPYVSPDSGRWVYGLGTPVYSGARITGILHLEIPLQWFTRELAERPFSDGSYETMLDRKGHMLIHPDLARWRAAEGRDGDPDTEAFPSAYAAGDPSWQAAVDEMRAGTEGSTTFREAGREYHIAYHRILEGDVIVASVVPDLELYADLERTRSNIRLTAGPLLLLMVGLTCWFSLRLLRGGRQLRTADAATSQLAAIVRSADDAILSVATDGTIRTWNDGAQRMYGYSASEAIGVHLGRLTEPGRESESRHILQTIAGGEPVTRYETSHRDRDGRRFDVSLTVSPIRDSTGRVTAASLVARDVTQHKELEAQLAHQALHDSLTGLPNRALFGDRLGHALARASRLDSAGKRPAVGVLFVDLDEFKVINDTLGHRVGDELLVAVAGRLEACLRPGDTAARLGGDEFTVLLENLPDVSETRRVAERLIEQIAVPVMLEGHRVVITASIGIAVSESASDRPEDLLRNADIALYEAKANGRARHETFDGRMTARAWQRLRLEGDIRSAIEGGELSVAYQPIVAVADGTLLSFEALVRWHHPERGWIAPSDFIPLAEQTGLIGPIGRMVLRTACHQLAAWRRGSEAALPLTLSVNVSPRELPQDDFEETVLATIAEAGLATSALHLEVTEGVELLSDPAGVEKLRRLRNAGVRIHIDDFGSGYASLGYFRELPVDAVKIDRTFIAGLGSDRQQTAIVTAALAFAAALDVEVIAEGVETEGQRLVLGRLGCRRAQGYLFARPATSDEVAQMLQAAVAGVVRLPLVAPRAPSWRPPVGDPAKRPAGTLRPETNPG